MSAAEALMTALVISAFIETLASLFDLRSWDKTSAETASNEASPLNARNDSDLGQLEVWTDSS
jgi:hypothetical protein